jgi:hypothetical protein
MPNQRRQRKPTSPARREASSRAWRSARAQGRWHEPRRWRSVRESEIVRSLLWKAVQSGDRRGSRKLAAHLGVSHTWVLMLRRQFCAHPERQAERQARYEDMWGPATLEQLREEQAKRQGDFVRYRPRRIKRPKPTPQQNDAYMDSVFGEGYSAKLRAQVKAALKKQRDWKRDYGHLPYEE